MKKIIHLSDLHIGHEDQGMKFREIIENINMLKQPAENYIIVLTGDIVENATISAHQEEAIDAIQRLKEYGYTVLVVPGNHDYGTGSWANKKYVQKFKEVFYNDTSIEYPIVDVIDSIVFIGLDSTAEELHWYDKMLAQGEIGEEQLSKLATILNNPDYADGYKKVVYLHHHPIDFNIGLQLKDRDKLEKIVAGKIDALLFGHFHSNHNSKSKIYNGIWGIPRVYNAGSSTFKNGNHGVHRIIDLSKADPRSDYDAKFISE